MIGWRIKVAALLFYGAFAMGVGAYVVDIKWQSDWDDHMLADAEVNLRAAQSAVTTQNKLTKERDDATRKATELQAIHDRTVADNRAANDRLRAEFVKLKAIYAADNPSTVISSAAAATDRLVLAQLLDSTHAAYGIVAEYADNNRKAVINCNAEYNAVRTALNE